jgi:7-carboxy-7-deazaguanine synthase
MIQEKLIQTQLPVMEAFYTIQGEGFHQGKAAYFIRLAGCDVGCFWCDVKDSWDAAAHPKINVDEIVKQAVSMVNGQWSMVNNVIAVVTGGEPLMHNLNELTAQLHKAGFQTNIETSGSSPLSGEWDWICVSPKKFKAPLDEILSKANELKVIVYNKDDLNWAEEHAAKVNKKCKLFLQPEWSKASIVTPMIVDYIKQNPQWELSLQIHKYINVP